MQRFFFLVFLIPYLTFAQNTNLSDTINVYEPVLALDTCTGMLEVFDTTGFPKNTRILLVQMQGASINTSNSSSYGAVSAMGGAGFYEINMVDSTASGQLFLKYRPTANFVVAGQLQVVSFPSFPTATVTDSLYAKKWNGREGGVLAFEVENTLTINAPIAADGAGFRGGAPFVATDNNCNWAFNQNDYAYPAGSWRAANKGEGIAKIQSGGELGRGAQANGGGGGNDHNSGGGGGGNQVAGGRGGNNEEPSNFGCDGASPGVGGHALSSTTQARIFLGGGGGAGHSNNGFVGRGGDGGGIVLIKAKKISGTAKITANGTIGESASGDGAGGGGAGGSILLFVTDTTSPLPTVRAIGGNGGSTDNSGADRCFGPGGGGAGGHIVSNLSLIASISGIPGVVLNSSNGCNGNTNGAQNGTVGTKKTWIALTQGQIPYGGPQPAIISQPSDQSVCAGDSVQFTCQTTGPAQSYVWQKFDGTNWQNVPNAMPYLSNGNTLTLSSVALTPAGAQFRCQVDFGNCASTLNSNAAFLDVSPKPSANFAVNQMGQTVSFTNMSQNYDLLTWDFGDGSSSINSSPNHSYTMAGNYTVNLTIWNACDTVEYEQTLTISAVPTAIFTVADTLQDCNTVSHQFKSLSTGGITSLTWSIPNAIPSVSTQANFTVNFPTSGVYVATLIVQNAAGADTLKRTFYVKILTAPVAAFTYQITGGTVQFTNQSTNYFFVSWTFDDGSPSIFTENPIHTFINNGIYVVTLAASNACGASILQQNVEIKGLVGTAEQTPSPSTVLLYPNPSSGQCTIDVKSLQKTPVRVRVFAADGRLLVAEKWCGAEQQSLDLSTAPAGLYFVELSFSDGSFAASFLTKI